MSFGQVEEEVKVADVIVVRTVRFGLGGPLIYMVAWVVLTGAWVACFRRSMSHGQVSPSTLMP